MSCHISPRHPKLWFVMVVLFVLLKNPILFSLLLLPRRSSLLKWRARFRPSRPVSARTRFRWGKSPRKFVKKLLVVLISPRRLLLTLRGRSRGSRGQWQPLLLSIPHSVRRGYLVSVPLVLTLFLRRLIIKIPKSGRLIMMMTPILLACFLTSLTLKLTFLQRTSRRQPVLRTIFRLVKVTR